MDNHRARHAACQGHGAQAQPDHSPPTASQQHQRPSPRLQQLARGHRPAATHRLGQHTLPTYLVVPTPVDTPAQGPPPHASPAPTPPTPTTGSQPPTPCWTLPCRQAPPPTGPPPQWMPRRVGASAAGSTACRGSSRSESGWRVFGTLSARSSARWAGNGVVALGVGAVWCVHDCCCIES